MLVTEKPIEKVPSRRMQGIRNPYKVPLDPDQGSLQLFVTPRLHFVSQPREAYRKKKYTPLLYVTSIPGVFRRLRCFQVGEIGRCIHTRNERSALEELTCRPLASAFSETYSKINGFCSRDSTKWRGGFPVFYF